MITLNFAAETVAPALSVAAMALCASTLRAERHADVQTAQVIPLTGTEPAAKIVIHPRSPNPSPRVEWR